MAKRKKKAASKSAIAGAVYKEQWKTNFLHAAFRTNFTLSLSQSMLEMLCAIADGVDWDRSVYGPDLHCPDHSISTGRCLEKRGLVTHYQQMNEIQRNRYKTARSKALTDEGIKDGLHHEYTCWVLTPAGEQLVELLKTVGLFIEADSAISKKARKA